MKKFKNKYRIDSVRLQNWDYGSNAAYFVTICTAKREHYFGEIENNQMKLTEIGTVAENEWKKTTEIRQDMNLTLGDFVVMPNHFHAIIGIGKNKYNSDNFGDDVCYMNAMCRCRFCRFCRGAMHRASTTKTTAIHHNNNKFGPQSKNLASIIRGFKSAVTTYARKNNILFDWQSRYHDHIIRNDAAYIRISHYIRNNIAQWENDKFYKKL